MTTSHRTAKEHAELASAFLERAKLDFAVGNVVVGSPEDVGRGLPSDYRRGHAPGLAR